VRLIELAWTGAFLAKTADQLSIFGEFQDAGVAAAMPFGDVDFAVGRHEYRVRLIEVIGVGGAAGFAESHEELAIRAEFENLMADRRAG
jgi:hypothetical protein